MLHEDVHEGLPVPPATRRTADRHRDILYRDMYYQAGVVFLYTEV